MEGHRIDPLLTALAAGDAEAFSDLYDRFGARLYHTAWGMFGRREDAEDAVQEVFAAIVRSRGRLAEVDDMTAYLFAALRRAAVRIAARRARQPVGLASLDEEVAERTDASGTDHPQSERLERALRVLPSEQRELIVLKIDGELTFAQIAKVLGISINTAASRYRYGLEKLRTALKGAS